MQTNPRLEMDMTRYKIPASGGDGEESGSDSGEGEDVDENWYRANRILIKPDAGKYFPMPVHINVNLREKFAESGLQVRIYSILTRRPSIPSAPLQPSPIGHRRACQNPPHS